MAAGRGNLISMNMRVTGDADVALTWDGPLPTSQTATGVATGSVGWTWADGTLRLETVDINGTEIDYNYDDAACRPRSATKCSTTPRERRF